MWRHKRRIITFLIALLLGGCHRSPQELEEDSPIPRLPIHLEVNLDHEGVALQEPYSFYIVDKSTIQDQLIGHCGIIITHRTKGVFSAHEQACPNCWPKLVATKLSPKEGILTVKCPDCKTIYSLVMGSGHPISGKGKYPLLTYRIAQKGWILTVY